MIKAPPVTAATATVPVRRLRGDGSALELDRLAVEAPLEIRFAGEPFTVLMRTPGEDEELVAGFLYTEGIVAAAAEIEAMRRPREPLEDCDNRLEVDLAPGRSRAVVERRFYASASCGVCGKSSIEDLVIRAPVVTSALAVPRALLASLPERLRAAQPRFAETGGLHGAALFDACGTLLAAREDVGRHNAVDKLVGWALAAGRLPLADTILIVSGRLGFEIVQKAIVAGVPLVGAVGAASSLAVALAERYGLTLATFLRAGSMNLYGATERVQ
jgi:FdhD protein